MKLYTLLFCFGAGLLQHAMYRSSLHMKLWIFWLFQLVPIAATIPEVILAFKVFHWWGFLICVGFFNVPDFILGLRAGLNPVPSFLLGGVVMLIATTLLIWG